MLFEIHEEQKIAFKRLSNADLKRSDRSHQTHIGLSVDSLTFMADNKTEYSAMLIFKDYCDILSCEIAKIQRANGNLDAPKISMGSNPNNVVNRIRDFARNSPNSDFYLLWFGLDSLTPVFWLLEENSYDYKLLNEYCSFATLRDRKIVILNQDSSIFPKVLEFIQSRIENVTLKLQKDLELSVETENNNPKFKDADVRKARMYINELGKQGEALVDEYLGKQKSKNMVSDYEWMNKSSEQGKPYDFYIKYANGLEQWVDVKTTEHEFEQAVIVSKNEIKFITEKTADQYAIYSSLKELQAILKICSQCLKYFKKLYRDIDYMTKSMSDYNAAMINYKIAFEPGPLSFSMISDEITILYEKEKNANINTGQYNNINVDLSKAFPIYEEYHEGCIPLYSLRAACSKLTYNDEVEQEGWIEVNGYGFTPNKERYFIVRAKGESMSPKIKDGDFCVFEWYNPTSGGSRNGEIVLIYAKDFKFADNSTYTIKEYRSEKTKTDDGWEHTRISLIPKNKDFEAFDLCDEQQAITIGRLICVIK